MFELGFSSRSRKFLKKLDDNSWKRIMNKIEELKENPFPHRLFLKLLSSGSRRAVSKKSLKGDVSSFGVLKFASRKSARHAMHFNVW